MLATSLKFGTLTQPTVAEKCHMAKPQQEVEIRRRRCRLKFCFELLLRLGTILARS